MNDDPNIKIDKLRAEVEALKGQFSELNASTKELVEAWQAAGKMLAFVKFVAGLVTAVAAAWVIVTQIIKGS